jgi:hypothetical protein
MTAPSSHKTRAAGLSTVAEVLATGTQLVVGRYRIDVESGRTWWSDEVYRLHGQEPGDLEPTIEVIRARTHPDDRARVFRTAAVALRGGRPFASAHRIVDPHGKSRTVAVTGQGKYDSDGTTIQVVGYVLDISPVTREVLERESQRAVGRAMVAAAVVEQVKGAVQAVRGVDEAAASEVIGDLASKAGVSAQVAATQVLAALRDDVDGDPAERLKNALAAVHTVDRPRGHEAQLARRRPSEPA